MTSSPITSTSSIPNLTRPLFGGSLVLVVLPSFCSNRPLDLVGAIRQGEALYRIYPIFSWPLEATYVLDLQVDEFAGTSNHPFTILRL